MRKVPSFTLLEVLLSVAVIAVLAGVSIPVLRTLLVRTDVDVAAGEVAQTWRRAQSLSQAGEGDSTWGVYVQVGSITLFKGSSYTSRDSSLDEVFEMSPNIAPSGLTEIVFAKLTGFPNSAGTLTLTAEGKVVAVTINAKGTISY